MPRSLEISAQVTLSTRIKEDLSAQIRQRVFMAGSKLPAVRELAKQYGVAGDTVMRAFSMLKDEGLVVSQIGKGTFVAHAKPSAPTIELLVCIHHSYLDGSLSHEQMWRKVTIAAGARMAAQRRGVAMVPVPEGEGFRACLHARARQGVVLLEPPGDETIFGGLVRYALDHDMPLCVAAAMDDSLPYVNTHRDKGIEQAVAHLLALGHTRIALVNGLVDMRLPDQKQDPCGKVRLGYMRGLKRAGLVGDPQLYVEAGTPELCGVAPTVEAVERLLSRSPRPTAIMCNNDTRAFLVMDILKKHGLRIPQDISVAGCDNDAECERCDPPLTSIDTQYSERGEAAVNYLVNRLQGRDVPLPQVTPRLVTRSSSGVPPGGSPSEGRAS